MTSLTVSIVTYQVDKQLFSKVLEGLEKAVRDAKGRGLLSQAKLVVVDNGNDVSYLREEILGLEDFEGRVIDNPDNVGFGRAHNQVLLECDSDMHLVLNPAAVMHPDGISEGLAYLAEHEETVMISPYAENSDGSKAYLCKRYPSVVDLFMRGFLPASLQEAASERLARYECRDLDDTDATAGVCVVSGCCMLAKTGSLKAVNGFSDHYFLYFEDFDLSLKISRLGSIDYLPKMRIVHYGGDASKKGLAHIAMFCRSAFTFFNRNGWKFA